ncbi:hypothetical protein P152DRAFT_168079 [Eremomyces bilateralis CBS 781.70]|uniref:Uncharacterized protein n=1 Tax=Eremomyces bilateralis CBS 781.70 TaxID=1392243 RepID=A0A6G1FU12_9PEZI|nr:uncharacterized protein P152DRAFT_168079 [Eremomyces bilateralis CBS 781.70]KAF1809287.1 hypothetical protein P152DRAFT_168079 [Eremomyces bilateralis CBS 781.70]
MERATVGRHPPLPKVGGLSKPSSLQKVSSTTSKPNKSWPRVQVGTWTTRVCTSAVGERRRTMSHRQMSSTTVPSAVINQTFHRSLENIRRKPPPSSLNKSAATRGLADHDHGSCDDHFTLNTVRGATTRSVATHCGTAVRDDGRWHAGGARREFPLGTVPISRRATLSA